MVKPFLPPKDSQWAAVRATDEHVLVVAGAGTGKTHTVVGRILYLLGVPVRGETFASPVRLTDIAAITFTNEAARDLKESLRSALRSSGRRTETHAVDTSRIGTIHSFCSEILRENALRAGLPPVHEVLEEGEARELAAQVARDTLVEALESGSIPGLTELLADWQTKDIDGWIEKLMRRPDRVMRLEAAARTGPADPHSAQERALLRLARRAGERLDAMLARDDRIDYDRIIHWTHELVVREPHVRRTLQRRIHTLIIDEFQDVDPVQKEIAYLLGSVREPDPQATRLMLVGDPKQSIYRFRGADVTAWTAVQRDFESDGMGRVLALRENFRSVPAILAMVETSVGRMLNEPAVAGERQDFEIPFMAVEPQREPHEPVAVEFITIAPGDDGKPRRVDDVRTLEADAIAARIRTLNEAGTPPQDIAILLSTWASVSYYEDALRRAGIRHYTLRRDGFLDTREIHDMVLALEVMRDPSDDRALAGFLRSPFIGVKDETLLRIVQHAHRPFWRHLDTVLNGAEGEINGVESESGRLARAAELLHRLGPLRDRLPAADLLRELLEETGYLAHLQLLGDDGTQAQANIRQFLGTVRAAGDIGMGDLIRVFRERRSRDDRVAEARVHARTDAVVTITSIHVAKGLEWPVVFWADLVTGRPGINDKLLAGADRICLGQPDMPAAEQPDPIWQSMRNRIIAEDDAERKRQAYVAATRARDLLIFSGIPRGEGGPGKHTIARWFMDNLPELGIVPDGGMLNFRGVDDSGQARGDAYEARVHVATAKPSSVANENEPPAIEAIESVEAPQSPVTRVTAGPSRHSATELLTWSRCARKHWLKYVAGIREPALSGEAKAELLPAVQRGLIVHDVLERLREEWELDVLLEDAIGRWDDNAPPPETAPGAAYRMHLREEIRSVADHPDYKAVAVREGARRELDFIYLHGAGEVAQGSIDLAAPTEDGQALELLDVKTTQCDPATAVLRAGHYGPQRDVYATAATGISGMPVRRFAFQFSRAAVQIAEDLDADSARAAADRFEQTLHRMADEAPRLTEHPHECRFCGYHRVRLCPGVRVEAPQTGALLDRLGADSFRSRFHLRHAELEAVRTKGIDTIVRHARDLIDRRLAPAEPDRDGRQTPWRGHPVFVAQHATATCCRRCLEKWHGIGMGRELTQQERARVVGVIEAWLIRETGASAVEGPPQPEGSQLRLL